MAVVTFQILEGVDKGRAFRTLPTPVTIGREEGNVLRLNDERVSRFHAKVQFDNGEIILTDLESTNGTRVNGNVIQIRRLRPGDRVGIGRSLLLFGSEEEIAARQAALGGAPAQDVDITAPNEVPSTLLGSVFSAGSFDHDEAFDLNPGDKITFLDGNLYVGNRPLPPLPLKLTPSQAARLAEVIDFLHRHLTAGTENIQASDDGTQVTLNFADWQRVLAVQMLLARYVRAVTEPETIEG
jgi:pSer/pThr/pTyr-binding forkhead associated (FHA) protein